MKLIKIKYRKLLENKILKTIIIFWTLFNIVMVFSNAFFLQKMYSDFKSTLLSNLLTQAKQSSTMVSLAIQYNKYSLYNLRMLINQSPPQETHLIMQNYLKYNKYNTKYIALASKNKIIYSYPKGFELPLNNKAYPWYVVKFTKECLKTKSYCIVPTYNYKGKVEHFDALALDDSIHIIKVSSPIIYKIKNNLDLPYKSITIGIIKNNGQIQANIPQSGEFKFQTGILARTLKNHKDFGTYEGYTTAFKDYKIGAYSRINKSDMTLFISIKKNGFLKYFLYEIYPLAIVALLGSILSFWFLYWTINKITSLEDKRRKFAKGIEYLAYNDILTHIPNRALFNQRFGQMIAALNRQKRKMALFMLDVDSFKNINDTFGHDEGDSVLKSVARKLRENIRLQDSVFRLGGDEFAILSDSFENEEDLKYIALRLIDNINNLFFKNHSDIEISISIGVAYTLSPLSKEILFKKADEALYISKSKGKNTYTILKVKDV